MRPTPQERERGEGGPSQNAFVQLFNEGNPKHASGHNAWRLIETAPASAGEEIAAIGFTLALARHAAKDGLLFFSAPQASLAEHGVPYAEGLAQFGIDLDAFLIAATRTQIDALWAAEQALKLPGAFVLCTIAPAKKPLDLIATRRLLLAAKRHNSRCALLRLDAVRASAAELRFEISSAPGKSAYGLGPPAFDVRLTRNRAGPAGGALRLQWSAHEYAFREIPRPLDGAPLPVPADGPVAPARARAG
jgi:protein ImuA